jgi:hypothetical protein
MAKQKLTMTVPVLIEMEGDFDRNQAVNFIRDKVFEDLKVFIPNQRLKWTRRLEFKRLFGSDSHIKFLLNFQEKVVKPISKEGQV